MKKLKKEKNKKSFKIRIVRILSIIFVIAVVIGGSLALYLRYNLAKISVDKTNNSGLANKNYNADKNNKDQNEKGIVNILLLGVDGAPGDAQKYDTNSDVMIFIRYDIDTKKVNMISIPRDTYVKTLNTPIPKINSAHMKGGSILAKKVVGDLLNTNVDYYVELNYDGFRKFIDAIDGVDIVIPRDMNYDDGEQNLHIHFNKGESQHLDGKRAEEFVRWRKNNDHTGFADGDVGRINKLQDFTYKVIEKLESPTIITKANKIMTVVTESVKTDMPVDEMFKYGIDFYKVNKSDINMNVLPGEFKERYNDYTKTKLDFYITDEEKLSKMLKSELPNNVQK